MRPVTASALALAALLSLPLPSAAQGRPFPYALSLGDGAHLAAGAALSALGNALGGTALPTAAEVAEYDPDDVNAFDRWATGQLSSAWGPRSDVGRYALLGTGTLVTFGPPLLTGRLGDAFTLGVMFTEAYLLVSGATYSSKRLTRRLRPYVYNTDLSVEERVERAAGDVGGVAESFWSGHAAGAFVVATLVSTIYGDLHGPTTASRVLWGSTLAAAGFTSWARVAAGKHYPSDVLAGALVGSAVGVLIPRLHRVEGGLPVEVSAGPAGIAIRIPH